MTKTIYQNLIDFYVSAEKLKTIIRHSYTSDPKRTESVAEHSWMLCLIAMTWFEHLRVKVDQLRVLKIVIIHDLAEIVTGDVPAFDTQGRIGKYEREKVGFQKLIAPLPEKTQKEFMELWEEYEAKETNESKVAQAIDKFEAPLQHNIFDISLWDQNDFDVHGRFRQGYLDIDPFLKELRVELEHMSRRKVTKADQLHRMKPEIQKFYKKLNEEDEK